jgi:dolichol-phosphate mannosyltransferase
MKPELSVIISALNEEKSVKEVLEGVLNFFKLMKINGEIIFLNNHSTDNTGEIADFISEKNSELKVIHRFNRHSKDLGSSLQEGLENVNGDYILIMDCDMSHDPKEIKLLFDKRKEADIIIGSRYFGGSAKMPLSRTLISKSSNFIVNNLLGVKVKDISTGFKLYKKEVFDNVNLENEGFGLHVEILLKAANKNKSMKEIPIHYERSLTDSKLNYKKQIPSYAKAVFSGMRDKFTN